MQAVIFIDIQQGFDDPFWGARNNHDAEKNAGQLLKHARDKGWAIFHVRHVSKEAGSPLSGAGLNFKPDVTPKAGESIIEKSVNSAFIGTDLEAQLQAAGAKKLIICGLTTPHCVSTTTRMAANMGYEVTLVHDACAAFDINADSSWSAAPAPKAQDIHDMALHHLHNEFASVCAVSDILTRD